MLAADSVEIGSAAASLSGVPAVEVAGSHFKLPFGISLNFMSFSQCIFIKGLEVLAHCTASKCLIAPIDFIPLHPTLPAGIRLDDAGIDGETFTLDQAGRHVAPQRLIEQPPE